MGKRWRAWATAVTSRVRWLFLMFSVFSVSLWFALFPRRELALRRVCRWVKGSPGLAAKADMTETTITLDSREEAVLLFGSRDTYLREIKNTLGAQIVGRGDQILVKGTDDQLALAERIFAQLLQMLRQQGALTMG